MTTVDVEEELDGAEDDEEVPSLNLIKRLHQKNVQRLEKLPPNITGLAGGAIQSMRLEMLIEATAGSEDEDNRKQFEWIFEERLADMLDNLEDQVKKLRRQAAMQAPGERRTAEGLIVPG